MSGMNRSDVEKTSEHELGRVLRNPPRQSIQLSSVAREDTEDYEV